MRPTNDYPDSPSPAAGAGSAKASSSIGRAPVSKTGGWGFDPLLALAPPRYPIENQHRTRTVNLLERAGAARGFLAEVRGEIGKVTWPTRNEVRGTTIIVLITVFFFGFYLYGLDVVMSYISAFITNLISG